MDYNTVKVKNFWLDELYIELTDQMFEQSKGMNTPNNIEKVR